MSGEPLSKVVNQIPTINLVRKHVPCSWEKKGTIMRKLIENTRAENVQLLDGVKIWHGKSWVIVIPDADKPIFHVNAEGNHMEESNQLALRYVQLIQEWQG
jgi:mannose-1-phosphate guanylyltransferase/phosphomannomutase